LPINIKTTIPTANLCCKSKSTLVFPALNIKGKNTPTSPVINPAIAGFAQFGILLRLSNRFMFAKMFFEKATPSNPDAIPRIINTGILSGVIEVVI